MTQLCRICGNACDGEGQVCSRCLADTAQNTTSFAPVGDASPGTQPEAIAAGDDFVLVITKGPSLGETFTIKPEEITIGRDVNADVFLNDMTVSREHATIVHRGDTAIIRDSGSLNGTYINGVCVDEAELHNGDEIQIGTFHLSFSHQLKA